MGSSPPYQRRRLRFGLEPIAELNRRWWSMDTTSKAITVVIAALAVFKGWSAVSKALSVVIDILEILICFAIIIAITHVRKDTDRERGAR